eukprot:Phypoly_transcript_05795.p1 GENE.Phypoly_transcript_05795~~Phypoly_transcript_05795.p1  ORF type:complete len:556 (+),score=32.73 Phypoly_transcript_05795:178-1845(+)
MHKQFPRHNLNSTILRKLSLSLPWSYELESRSAGTVSSSEVQRVAREYYTIIDKIIEYGSDYERKYTQLTEENRQIVEQNSQMRAQLTQLQADHELLVSKFSKLVTSGDMEFHVNGTAISAHSAIVSVWSFPFETMLCSPMREGVSKCIEIKDEEPEIVQMMVSYFYTGKVDLNCSNALPLLRLSALYDIVSLRLLFNLLFSLFPSPLFFNNIYYYFFYCGFLIYLLFIYLFCKILLKLLLFPFSYVSLLVFRDLCCTYLLGRISLENCLELFLISWLHEQEETVQWKRLLDANTEFITKNSSEILRQCSDTVSCIGLVELCKIWPLLEARGADQLVETFLSWATQHWNVLDLSECLVHISGEIVDNLKKTEATSGPYSTALAYFLDFCVNSIVEDFDTQHKQSGFLKIDSEYLALILQNNDLNVVRESTVLESLISWTQADTTREVYLPKLLECVRFPYIGASELVKIPISAPLIGKCALFGSLLQEALHFQMKGITSNSPYISNSRVRRRNHWRYQTPSIDAVDFVTYVSTAVLQLTKIPGKDDDDGDEEAYP